MPKIKTKYKIQWEDIVDTRGNKYRDWLRKFNEYTAYCNFCEKSFSISNSGKQAVTKHSTTQKHLERLQSSSIDQITEETDTTKQNEEDNSLDEKILKAEILWCIATAEHDISFLTSDHATKLFRLMFPDSPVASGFRCSRTKTSYIINDGISVANQEKLKEKLNNNIYSILIDESNKNYGEKYLCLMVRYYDEEEQCIQVKFLDLKKNNKSNSDTITKLVVESVEEKDLSFDNCIQIMSDNVSANRGCHNGAVIKIKDKYAKHLIDIGGCSLHHVTNACEHALKQLFRYEELEDFVQDTSAFFSFHVEFADILQDLQKVLDLQQHRILKYCSVRFLSIYIVVNRFLEQYQALVKLITVVIPKYHPKVFMQPRVQRIVAAMNNKYTLPTLYLIQFSLENFQKYEKLFQRETPTIHLLYDKQVDLFRNTLLQFCKIEIIEKIKDDKELTNFEFSKSKNQLS